MMTGTNKIDKTIYASLLIFKSSYKNGGEKPLLIYYNPSVSTACVASSLLNPSNVNCSINPLRENEVISR